ncbi:unnamed protein product, partial [Owenia fusiformis]
MDDMDTLKIRVIMRVNQGPVVNVIGDVTIVLPIECTLIDGSNSTDDIGVVRWQWMQLGGPETAKFAQEDSPTTEVCGLTTPGEYEIKLVVFDEDEVFDEDTMTIIVKDPKIPPVANAGKDKVIVSPEDCVTVDGSKSTDDKQIVFWRWELQTAPGRVARPKIKSEDTPKTGICNLEIGEYIFELIVFDEDELSDTDTVTITVIKGNAPPVADAGADQVITLPENCVIVDGKESTDDEAIVFYIWEQKGGPAKTDISDQEAEKTEICGLTIPGEYEFQLFVSDADEADDTDRMKVTVIKSNKPPVADAGPDQRITLPKECVELDGGKSSDDEAIVFWRWEPRGGPGEPKISSDDESKTEVCGLTKEGTYEFELIVFDEDELSDTDTVKIIVEPGNEPPVANAGKDQIIRLPNTCTTLSGKQSTDDVKVEVYVWEFVNGPSEGGIQDENEALTRACGMDVGGEYTYKLTVFDIEGLESSDTVTITVRDKPKARGPCLAEADVVFILDSSGSIGEDSFEKMLDFVRDVVERFDIDGGAVRIGLITYSDAAVSVFRLNEHKTTEDVVKGLKQVEYRYGLTHTSDALRLMRTQMFTEAAGDRPNVVNVAIIITDSESNVNHEMTVPEARLVKEDGITVLGVGIGLSERRHELEGIASAPQLVHFVHDYESLINNTASLTDPICVDDQDCASIPCENGGTCIEGLGGYTCRCKYGFGGKSCETKCPKEADIIFIVDSSASVGEQNFQLLKETVSTMVEQMDIESCGIQVGMVTYSTAARIQFHLNAHRTKVGILNAVDSVNYMDGYTHTADGIAAAHKQMFLTRFGDRPDARNVAVLLTDGYHNINLAKTLPSAREAEQDGIYVVTIGVAIPNKREMTEIASLRDEGSFYVDIFRDAPNTVKRVRKLIFEDEDQCKGNPCKNGGKCEDGIKQFKCTCPAGYSGKTCERSCESKSDVVFVVDASNRVGRDTFRLVKEFITQIVEEFEFTSGNT